MVENSTTPTPTDIVALLREAAEILLDPPLQPAPSWLTETPRNVREPMAAWLDRTAELIESEPPRPGGFPKKPAVDLARTIVEAMGQR